MRSRTEEAGKPGDVAGASARQSADRRGAEWSDGSPGRVAEVMVRQPKTLPASASIADSDTGQCEAGSALGVATLTGRTVAPEAELAPVHARMVANGQRRLAVVDATGHLLGLLCLKRTLAGFCSDRDVASRATQRTMVCESTPRAHVAPTAGAAPAALPAPAALAATPTPAPSQQLVSTVTTPWRSRRAEADVHQPISTR